MTRFLLSLFLILPVLAISPIAIAILLLTSWDGRTTWFGNAKHGSKGITYWQRFKWLVLQNPVYNLLGITLAVPCKQYVITGDAEIGDHTHGGKYNVSMSNAWEIYWIKSYGKHCIRFRAGWKINGKTAGDLCEWVLTFNPLQTYTGS